MLKLKFIGWSLIGASVLVALLVAAYWLRTAQYTVYADDQLRSVRGSYDRVDEVLTAAGVELRPQDKVSPSLSAQVEPEGVIQVERARAVEVVTDGTAQVFWTHQAELMPFLEEVGIEVRPSFLVTIDGQEINFEDLTESPLPDGVVISRFKTVQIDDEGQTRPLRTGAETVGEALDEAGITLMEADSVKPGLDAWLSPGLEIVIDRAEPVGIQVDGNIITQRTNMTRTADILSEAGVVMGENDYSIPAPDFEIFPGNVIRVVRVTEEYAYEDEAIPYDSLWQASDQLDLDQRAMLTAGEPGIMRRRILVRYEDGQEVSRELDAEWVEKEPVDEINGYGTRIVVRVLETPEGSYEYWRVVRMRATAYTAATSGKPPDHPAYGITASGVQAGTGVVAVDPNVVPFRSWVYVPGYGVGYAGDTGGGIKGRWIDLGYNEGEIVAWNTYVDVYYLTPVPPAEDIAYLIPTYLP